ncbi:MAG: hypothetical protein ACM30I_10880 [Gemmatimonas sp.]
MTIALALAPHGESHAGQTATLALVAHIPPAAALAVSAPHVVASGSPQVSLMVTERANTPTGYLVTLESENAVRAGRPVLAPVEGGGQPVAYRLRYGGRDVLFTGSRATLTDSRGPVVTPVAKEFTIEIPRGPVVDGFRDTLWLTVLQR